MKEWLPCGIKEKNTLNSIIGNMVSYEWKENTADGIYLLYYEVVPPGTVYLEFYPDPICFRSELQLRTFVTHNTLVFLKRKILPTVDRASYKTI